MPKQREIREKVLLSLFTAATHEEPEGDLWDLCFEPELDRITKLKIKTVKHQLQAFPRLHEELVSIIPITSALLRSYEQKDAAKALIPAKRLSEECHSLFPKLKAESDLQSFFPLAKELKRALTKLHELLIDAGLSDPQIQKLTNLTVKLLDLTNRAALIAEPTEASEEKSLLPLVKATNEYHKLRSETANHVTKVRENLELLDEKIQTHLANYSQEQIGKVERNILRLGAYEILILNLPKAVVINESLELTKRYASYDAAPLVNGVLDKL